MSVEFLRWVAYAEENLAVARMALEGGHFNAALQNIQQAVEKFLKSSLLALRRPCPRTHSIETLNDRLREAGKEMSLSDEDCAFLDAIYIPSKYPVGSALPDFDPTAEIVLRGICIAESVHRATCHIVKPGDGRMR